jgi:hypothetical protein
MTNVTSLVSSRGLARQELKSLPLLAELSSAAFAVYTTQTTQFGSLPPPPYCLLLSSWDTDRIKSPVPPALISLPVLQSLIENRLPAMRKKFMRRYAKSCHSAAIFPQN